jgi:hypothetical protein
LAFNSNFWKNPDRLICNPQKLNPHISHCCVFCWTFFSQKRRKFSSELLAHHTVDVEVEAGVEEDEDMAEVIYTEPEGRDGVEASLDTKGYSGINAFKSLN